MDNEPTKKELLSSNLNKSLESVLKILETDDGKSFEEKKTNAIAYINSCIENSKEEKQKPKLSKDNQMQATFWMQGEPILASETVSLRREIDTDMNAYISIQQDYNVFKDMLRETSFCDTLWEEHTAEKTLMAAIVQDGAYIGYCGIQDTSCNDWEFSIEIQTERTNQGVGFTAVTAFLDEVRKRLNVSKFRIRIDPGNYPSQKLFEKLGATPNGISELWVHDEPSLVKCEEENLHQIDDHIIALAKKFSVEPRKLLSHILEYTLLWK